jgi:hypothetical protein
MTILGRSLVLLQTREVAELAVLQTHTSVTIRRKLTHSRCLPHANTERRLLDEVGEDKQKITATEVTTRKELMTISQNRSVLPTDAHSHQRQVPTPQSLVTLTDQSHESAGGRPCEQTETSLIKQRQLTAPTLFETIWQRAVKATA